MGSAAATRCYCPVGYPLYPLADDPPSNFHVYGTESNVPPAYGMLQPCVGSRADANTINGSPCIEPGVAGLSARLLGSIDEWQKTRPRNSSFPLDAWQQGTGAACGGACPTHVFFEPLPRGVGGAWDSGMGAIVVPPADSWNHIDVAWPVHRHAHDMLGVLAHEYFHEFQSAWARQAGLTGDDHIGERSPWLESSTVLVGLHACIPDYRELLADPTRIDEGVCVAATRLKPLYNTDERRYLLAPRHGLLSRRARAHLFWHYAIEQFALPPSEPGDPQPARPPLDGIGTRSAFESTRSEPLGLPIRAVDEGIDLYSYVLQKMDANRLLPTVDAVDLALTEHLRRNFESVVLDMHTSMVLKDYTELPDTDVNPRWALEWVGNPNVDATKTFFPDHPPPHLAGKLTIAQAKATNLTEPGRLPIPQDRLWNGVYDYLPRAWRLLEDWDYTTHNRIYLAPGESEASPEPYQLGAFGAAVLSVHPAASYGILRVRVFEEGAPPPRVRVFTVSAAGVPTLHESCDWPPSEVGPEPVDHCRYSTVVAPGGAQRTLVDVPVRVRNNDPWVPTDVDEVLVIVSAGKSPTAFSWHIGLVEPYIVIRQPTTAQPVHIGHPDVSRGAQPFLLEFVVADELNQPISVTPEDIVISVPGCPTGSCPGCPTAACHLEPKPYPSATEGDYWLQVFEPGVHWAVVTVPNDLYPPLPPAGAPPATLDIRVQAPDYRAAVEEQALIADMAPPRSFQLVVDASESMLLVNQSKLRATQIAGRMLIDALTDVDAVGVVRFQHDARTLYDLRSICDGDFVRQDAIDALLDIVPYGCTSIGDGLFEAQANVAVGFDVLSGYWASQPADCLPTSHTVMVLSDGDNNSQYHPEDYYLVTDYLTQALDGKLDATGCGPDNDLEDNALPTNGWLRYRDRSDLGLAVPSFQAIAIGDDADVLELQRLLNHTSGGQVLHITEPLDGSFAEEMRLTIGTADAFRQGMDEATGHQRAGAWQVPNFLPEGMPPLEVEPFTSELLVSVASARDDTSLLRLVDPEGEVLEPTVGRVTSSVFRVPDPAPGTWTWQYAGNPCPPEPACPTEPPAAFVEQAVHSLVVLLAETDVMTPWPAPDEGGPYDDGRVVGSDVYIRALPTDGGAILGAVATVEVTTPADSTSVLELRDDGKHADGEAHDGVYGALFRDTALVGSYRMRVRVDGYANATGAPFRRERSMALHLHHGSDIDGDGLPDWWELRFGEDATSLDPGADPDDDGLSSLDEFFAHTSPIWADTDSGGEADGSEVGRGADPLDPADDSVLVFQPRVAPGNGHVLVAVDIPPELAAELELQAADEPLGSYVTRFSGVPPEDNLVVVDALNDEPTCYRMRTVIGSVTSGWSAAECVTPRIDPFPPALEVSLPPERVTLAQPTVTVRVAASDLSAAALQSFLGPGTLFHGVNWDADLLDPTVEASGVTDMLVSLRSDFADTGWQPHAPETTVELPDAELVTVFVKVRDAAGNESPIVPLAVHRVDDFPREAVVGTNSIWLRQNSMTTGDVAVLDASAGPVLSDQAEAVVGIGTSLLGSVRADSILIKSSGVVTADAQFNELVNNGTIQGAETTPLGLPLALLLPELPELTPGGEDITLVNKEDRILDAGSYGTVKLTAGTSADPTVLTLSGGVYDLLELDLGDRSRFECQAPCEVRVAERLLPGQNAYLGPANGSGLGAPEIRLLIGGINGTTGNLGATPKAATIGYDNTVVARMFVPNGTLLLRQGTVATGTFVARDVQVGIGVQVFKDGG